MCPISAFICADAEEGPKKELRVTGLRGVRSFQQMLSAKSEFTNHISISAIRQVVSHKIVDVLAQEPNGSITQNNLTPANVIAAWT